MSEMTPEHEARTFRAQPGGHLAGGIVLVVIAVSLALVIVPQGFIGIWFKIVLVLGCILFTWFGIRFARQAVQVRDGQLIARNSLRTRKINASEIRGITFVSMPLRGGVSCAPRIHLASGGKIRLAALWTPGTRLAPPPQLVATVEEIQALLRIHPTVQ